MRIVLALFLLEGIIWAPLKHANKTGPTLPPKDNPKGPFPQDPIDWKYDPGPNDTFHAGPIDDNGMRALPPGTYNPPKGYEGIIASQYPWNFVHDVPRTNKQSWRAGLQNLKDPHPDLDKHDDFLRYCIHVKPNTRQHFPPLAYEASPPSSPLPKNCTDLLHKPWTYGDPQLISCGSQVSDIYQNSSVKHYPNYTVYMGLDGGWEDPEHCRAGCETCFDAMAEYGAEQAICRRVFFWSYEPYMPTDQVWNHRPSCGMGVVMGKPPLKYCKKGLKRKMQTDCVIDWDKERWRELGYRSTKHAMLAGMPDVPEKFHNPYVGGLPELYEALSRMDSMAGDGDIKVYYVSRLPKAGRDVFGLEKVGAAHVMSNLLEMKKLWQPFHRDTIERYQKGIECRNSAQEPGKWNCSYIAPYFTETDLNNQWPDENINIP